MLLVPLYMSPSLCSSSCKPSDLDSSEPVISLLTVPPSWPGDGVTQMLPTDTLLPIILFPFCGASAYTPSSVVVLVSLSSFCFLLPIHTMPLLHNPCWHGPNSSIRSVLGLFVWTRLIGAYV